MKKKVRRTIVTVLSIAVITGSSLTAYAAPEVMPDGTTFDAEFYAANNPDVVAGLWHRYSGALPALYGIWQSGGKKGRI